MIFDPYWLLLGATALLWGFICWISLVDVARRVHLGIAGFKDAMVVVLWALVGYMFVASP